MTTSLKPILKESNERLVIFTIKYGDIWGLYKKAFATFWTTEELELSKDKEH